VTAIAGVLALSGTGIGASASYASVRTPRAHRKAAGSPWVLGAILDLTGSGSTEGVTAKVGITYEINEINAHGGVAGRRLKLDMCDTQSTPTGGSECASKLAGVNSHIILLLSSLPPTQGAVTQIPKDLAISILPNLFPKAGTNVFQDNQLESVEVDQMLKEARFFNDTATTEIYTSTSSGSSLLAAASKEASKFGISVISEPMDPTATDVTPQLTQLRSNGAQFLFAATIGSATNAVLSSYHTLGLNVPIVLNAADVGESFLQSLSFPIPPKLYGIANLAFGPNFAAPVRKAWANLEKAFVKSTGQTVGAETSGDVFAGCIAARVLLRTHASSAAAEVSFLAHHTISCFGSQIRYNIPGLNVPTGLPSALVQAGKTARDGWGPVHTPF
jgi:ABC-type branched-subunit amino acid transport system substrate-binding protein